MILPEDTKVPIYSDDEDEYEDEGYEDYNEFAYNDQALDHYRGLDYITYPAYEDDDRRYPPHEPLLFGGQDDIELGPAPPYTPHRPSDIDSQPPPFSFQLRSRRQSRRLGSEGKRAAEQWSRKRKAILGGMAALTWTIMVVLWMRSGIGRHRRLRFGRPPGQGEGLEGMEGLMSQDGHQDGVAVSCPEWSEDGQDWMMLSPSGSHLPSQAEGEVMWSMNKTFWLPTTGPAGIPPFHAGNAGNLFAHMVGPAAIGNIFVDTYDAEVEPADLSDSNAIVGTTKTGKTALQSDYVRIIVEPIVTTLSDESVKDSAGFRSLRASRICLMKRKNNHTELYNRDPADQPPPPPPPSSSPPPGPPRPEEDSAMGVGIYTRKSPDHPESRHPTTPLQFRIYISLPATSPSSSSSDDDRPAPSFAQGLIDAISGYHTPPAPPSPPPANFVRSLCIRGGTGGTYISDMAAATIGSMTVENAVGEIEVDHLRVEDLKMKTTGRITGHVSVSNLLDVDTPVGDIDLNLTLAARPTWGASPPPPPPSDEPPSEGFKGDKHQDSCSLSPISVSLRSGSGTTRLRYGDWEEPCRPLSQDVFSLVGTVEVFPHPLFQGPFHLSSALGGISVELPPASSPTPDPLNQGRERHITLDKHDRLGSKFYRGTVEWTQPGEEGVDSHESSTTPVAAQSQGADSGSSGNHDAGADVSAKRPSDHQRPSNLKPGMEVKTSTGSIRVVF